MFRRSRTRFGEAADNMQRISLKTCPTSGTHVAAKQFLIREHHAGAPTSRITRRLDITSPDETHARILQHYALQVAWKSRLELIGRCIAQGQRSFRPFCRRWRHLSPTSDLGSTCSLDANSYASLREQPARDLVRSGCVREASARHWQNTWMHRTTAYAINANNESMHP